MFGKVSVIIPVYNSAHTIKRCLTSVVEQTYKNKEIIIIDDGSTDTYKDNIRDYLPLIRIIEQENAGAGMARNRGIQEATGEYITFLDADDAWENVYLEKMIAYMEATKSDICVCAVKRIEKNRNIAYVQNNDDGVCDNLVNVLKYLLSGKILGTVHGKLFRRELIWSNHIYFPQCRVSEDLEFAFLCLCAAKKISMLSNALYTIYDTGNSLCNTYTEKFLYSYEAMDHIKDTLCKMNIYKQVEDEYVKYYLHTVKWLLEYSVKFYNEHGGELEEKIVSRMKINFGNYRIKWATGKNEKLKIILLKISPKLYCWVLRHKTRKRLGK